MSEPAANEAGAALSAGARLAQARERLGMSLEQVADKLKLDPHTVAALEAGDYRVIGAAVFVRGFLRRYAQLVGDSPAEIEALYARQPESSQAPDLARVTVRSERRSRPRKPLGPWPAALVVVLLLAGGIWWWATHRAARAHEESVVELGTPPASAVSAAPAAPAAQPAPATALMGGNGTATGQAAAPPAPLAAEAEAAALAAKLAALPRKHLEMRVNDESWVEAYDARGMRLQFGFAHAGATLAMTGTPPFRLVLGNAGAVEISLEGAAVRLPEAAPGARLRVSISGKGVVTLRP
jgi:cytoskeleton protein RodZ